MLTPILFKMKNATDVSEVSNAGRFESESLKLS